MSIRLAQRQRIQLLRQHVASRQLQALSPNENRKTRMTWQRKAPLLHALNHLQRLLKLLLGKVPFRQQRVHVANSHGRFDVGRGKQPATRE